MMLTENAIAGEVVQTCYEIHRDLGPGFFEQVYEEILSYELKRKHLKVARQVILPLVWKGCRLNKAFRADLLVGDKVIVEIKAVESLTLVHQRQVLNYLRFSGMKLGLLVNFNEINIKTGLRRFVNNL